MGEISNASSYLCLTPDLLITYPEDKKLYASQLLWDNSTDE